MSDNDFKDEGQDVDDPSDLDFEGPEDSNVLTDWANEPTLEALKADLEDAQPDAQAHQNDVKRWRNAYDGKPDFKVSANRSKIVPKVIRKQAEWRYAALSEPFLSADSMFEVEPVTWEDKPRAKQNALVINHQMNNRIHKINFVDEYVRTAVDEGTVIVKVGWVAKKGTVQRDVPVFEYKPAPDEETAQQMTEQEMSLEKMRVYSPLDYEKVPEEAREAHDRWLSSGGIPFIPVQTGTKRVSEEKFIKNWPTLEVVPYDKITEDPTADGVMEDSQFTVYEFESTLSELRKDGRYKNLNRIDAKNVLADPDEDTDDDEQTTFQFRDKPRQKLKVFEYWGFYDINGTGKTKPFVAAWIGDVKIRMEENPFPDKKLPFIRVKYLPVVGDTWGESDGELLMDNQRIVGAITRGMIDMMGRSAAGQQGVRKDALDTVNKRRFEKGDDYQFNANVDPRQAFQMGEFPEIPRSALEMINLQNNEAEAITGVKTFSQGISGAALGSTATAVRGALDAASKRELGILRRLADGVVQIGRKFISMNSEFLDDEEIIRITEDDFVVVRRDDLAGEYDVSLSISTAESDNEKAQELSFMLQTGAASQDPGEVRIIRAEIARLRNMPALAKRIEEYEPTPDPVAQENAVLENEKLKAEIAELYSKAEENEVDKAVKGAKVGTEEAKARDMNSRADKQDLDFLEQKEGVSHERDMDVQDAKNLGANEVAATGAEVKTREQDLKAVEAAASDEGDKVASLMKNFNL